MKWKLIAVVERADGSLFRQNIKFITDEESKDNALITKLIREYKYNLGEDYFIIDYYIGY